MTKLLSLAAVIGVSFFCVAAAQSMPLAPLEQARPVCEFRSLVVADLAFTPARMAAAVATATTAARTTAAL